VDAGQQNQNPLGLDPLNQLGFKDIDKFSGILFRLNTNEWIAGGSNDFGIRGAAPRENPNWSVTPNMVWLKGRHNLKIGAWFIDSKRIQMNTFQRYSFGGRPNRPWKQQYRPLAGLSSVGFAKQRRVASCPSQDRAP